MAVAERRAETTWTGDLMSGNGVLSFGSSNVLKETPVTWAARTEAPGGKTSPEELIAAAHASCYAMAFSNVLGRAGHAPERLNVSAIVVFSPKPGGGNFVSDSRLVVRGRVPGVDQARFEELARQGEQGCPVSNALRGSLTITVEASST